MKEKLPTKKRLSLHRETIRGLVAQDPPNPPDPDPIPYTIIWSCIWTLPICTGCPCSDPCSVTIGPTPSVTCPSSDCPVV